MNSFLSMPHAVPPLLEVNDLRVSFGATEAVRGVSFTVHEGVNSP